MSKPASVAVVGGDARQTAAARALRSAGVEVRTACLPGEPGDDPGVALRGADVWLLPPTPIGDERRVQGVHEVYVETSLLKRLRPGGLLLGGRLANPALEREMARLGLTYHNYGERTDFADANAELTAEGTLAHVLVQRGAALAGMRVTVLGYGRCGQALARKAAAWGAEVTVVARSAAARQRAVLLGFAVCGFDALDDCLARAEAVINTVPAMVLAGESLHRLPPDAYIVDLASAPGGVDVAAAQALGLSAEALPGVPGRMVPRSAGRIVASVALTVIRANAEARTSARRATGGESS